MAYTVMLEDVANRTRDFPTSDTGPMSSLYHQ